MNTHQLAIDRALPKERLSPRGLSTHKLEHSHVPPDEGSSLLCALECSRVSVFKPGCGSPTRSPLGGAPYEPLPICH